MTHRRDRTEFKKILKELAAFSIPLILSGILQQLYSWADAFIVGNAEGETALGAIGGTGSAVNFYLLAISGFTIGIAVAAGQKYGGRDLDFVNRLLTSFSVILGASFLVLSVVGFVFMSPFLKLLNTPPEIFGQAELYLKIILGGVPFLAVYNVFSAVLRGVGDTKAPFYSICVSSGINIVLDILLVAVLPFGVAGAAAATVFSQIVMTVYLIIYTFKKHPELKFMNVREAMTKPVLSTGFRFGIPPMIQSSIKGGGNLILQNFMNGFGTATVVAITTAYRIDSLAILPVSNLSAAVSALTAQSYGAKEEHRLGQIKKAGVLSSFVTAAVLTALVLCFGRFLIAMFGAGPEATEIGRRFFLRLGSFYVIYGMNNAIRGYLEGIGYVMYSSVVGILMLASRIILSYAFAGIFGNMIIAFAEAFSWLLGLILFAVKARISEKNRK